MTHSLTCPCPPCRDRAAEKAERERPKLDPISKLVMLDMERALSNLERAINDLKGGHS